MPLTMPPQDLPTVPIDQMALFLDVDGTLLDIAPTPDSVVVTAGLKELLRRLYDKSGGALALVSGRAISDLDSLLDPIRLPTAGQHGAEWRLLPDEQPRRLTELPDGLRRSAVALALRHPGMLVEDKGGAIALHVRSRPELAAEIGAALALIVQDYPSHEVMPGKAVFEIRQRGIHKGAAVEALIQHPPFAGRVPVFLGDDVTDLDAIELVRARAGYGLLVSPAGPLRCPSDVHRWLGTLVDQA